SELFLSGRPVNVPGSVVTVSLEGTRPLLVEIQALVSPSSFGVPRRTALGVDYNRVNLLIAVLDKRLGMHLGGMDIYVNVVGGLKIYEPAIDMGIIGAIVSSFRNHPVSTDIFTFGEVGLSGELRAISQAAVRIKEASKLGFKKGIVPATSGKNTDDRDIDIRGVRNVEEAVEILMF
ncbi:MAG: DNA repair protein RadA, partial [Nitrospirota bacterium]|nr:DNA repair protein RadA [Nitrospirota bacterium]